MKNPTFPIVALLCAGPLLAVGPTRTDERIQNFDRLNAGEVASFPGEEAITQDLVRAHVTYLASDENKGRDSGAGPLEGRVTEYIENIWGQMGLQKAGDAAGTTYRQPFQVRRWNRVAKGDEHSHEIFGHLPNELGVALSPDGKIATVDEMPEGLDFDQLLREEAVMSHNLLGIIPGSDPALKDQYLVIGAHMDHIGVSSWGSGDKVYNGADDNGSGTSSVLALCRALTEASKSGRGPKRSILVCLFSGEELGLVGSTYLVNNPTLPLEKIKGMLNIDMIGRCDPKQVSVFDNAPGGAANLFHALHDTQGTGLTKIDHDIGNLVNRSDQYAFYRKGIPVTFFFEGYTEDGDMNPDYHGRGDHADKIEFTKLTDITRFVYRHVMGAAALTID